MRCTSPRTVGFLPDGKTISWSPKTYSKEYATFQLPCGKCLECRLEYARQWAIRCVHEAQMYENNIFLTLTYSPENLKSAYLDYADFQKFMKKLRKTQNEPIGVFVTGEYGEENHRPHWHAILFNYEPKDKKPKYTTKRGDQVFSSETIDKIWGMGNTEFGGVTFESAGYCARYSAKKIVHGENKKVKEADFHPFQPISKKSTKHAIGKKWLEKFWPDVFNYGTNLLRDGTPTSIPRYYEKWLKQHHPQEWNSYVTKIKAERIASAEIRSQEELNHQNNANAERRAVKGYRATHQRTQREAQIIITESKFNLLQKNLKL